MGMELFVMLALLAVSVLVIRVLADQEAKQSDEGYDERQELQRGRGYRAGFYTVMVWSVLMYIAVTVDAQLPFERDAGWMLGAFFGFLVFSVYCIWHDAFFARTDKRDWRFFFIFGALWVFRGIKNAETQPPVENGKLTMGAFDILAGIILLLIGAVIVLRRLRAKREGDEGDGDAA